MHSFRGDMGVSGGAHGGRRVLPALAVAQVSLGCKIQTWGSPVLSWPGAMRGVGPSPVPPDGPSGRGWLSVHPPADLQDKQGRLSPS